MQLKKCFFLLLLLPFVVFAQKINQFDAQGERHGYWEKSYNSGRIKYSGKFNHGKEIGIFYFYENKIINNYPAVKKIFKPNSNVVDVIFYDLYGTLQSDGEMINKKRSGLWKYYDGKRNIILTEEYKDGNLHGERVVYFNNGKKAEESHYINGKLDGVSIRYSQKGTVLHEMSYKNGLLHGRTKFYETNGDIKETGLYYKDYKVGKWDFYIKGEYMGYKIPNKQRSHPDNQDILANIQDKKEKPRVYPKISNEDILENIERKKEKERAYTELTDEEILKNIKGKKGEKRTYSKVSDDAILKSIATKMDDKIKEYKRLDDALILRNIKIKQAEEEKNKIKKLSDEEILQNIENKKKQEESIDENKLSDEQILENIRKKRAVSKKE
ncbi:antitoxin component YwqK of YwqJK toxin-antitoxin module [Wenyingzhuangia heitensis]|uniref:Antitoxin component YwqK of YwqJK toxin-antitoxin module n=1 Tax=Wenyingzhuangia heitensis TaxID=1487859 RepID=A0ABX0UCR5_9FLAO|nr:hypothetical protein [Wenyingzhuangia heitensis]NIJ46158.1 antitoxin component YwqK of YwqJK toxin-antitoxin module [Wenyingzhuangia heitensis]